MSYKNIDDTQIDNAMPEVGPNTPDANRPTIKLTNALLKDLRDNVDDVEGRVEQNETDIGDLQDINADTRLDALETIDAGTRLDALETRLYPSQTITDDYEVVPSDSGTYILCDTTKDITITLNQAMVIPANKVFEVTIINLDGYKVNFEDNDGAPVQDLDGNDEIAHGGVARAIYDSNQWIVRGDLTQ